MVHGDALTHVLIVPLLELRLVDPDVLPDHVLAELVDEERLAPLLHLQALDRGGLVALTRPGERQVGVDHLAHRALDIAHVGPVAGALHVSGDVRDRDRLVTDARDDLALVIAAAAGGEGDERWQGYGAQESGGPDGQMKLLRL